MDGLRSRRAVVGSGLAAVLVVVLAVGITLVVRPGDEPAPPAAADRTTSEAAPTVSPGATVEPDCVGGVQGSFRPQRFTVAGVVDAAEVIALPRDERNVPGVPALDDKHVLAWDRGGIEPGSTQGNVLLNTHTWPDGSAMGNTLLDELGRGDRIMLTGDGSSLCYEVTRRIEVRAADGYPPYYDTEGPPQLAIVVCSGERTGPGEWTHRTLWFASPVA